jgi:Ni/Co efflux regulator RcnB
MRKMLLLAVLVAMAVMMLAAAPAMADERDWDWDNRDWDRHDDKDFDKKFDHDKDHDKKFDHGKDFDKDFCFFFDCNFDKDFFDEFCDDFDGDFFCDEEENFFGGGDISQETEQVAESGDVWQSFDVSQTGDNSNQCVGVQGVANTGNAQNTINVFNLGGEDAEFEFDDVGSTIDVSPVNTTTCDQAVNQAATAYGGYDYYGGGYYW